MIDHPKLLAIHIKIEKYILKTNLKFRQIIIPCVFLQKIGWVRHNSAVEVTTFSWQVNSNIDTAFQNKGNN